MKLFLDTNIFLDLLFKRTGSEQAERIFQLIQNQLYNGFVADITLLNIDYIAQKQSRNVRQFLYFIEQNFVVLGAENRDILTALELDNDDLEDNVQFVLAKKSSCNLIISNDNSFLQVDIPVVNSSDFVEKYGINLE
ncbi:MAG: PIN domain-containing protein [Gammaproteobacteria bacterium]|nr:PIN domain-containing protein [Gammaproteobacteria bacterium]